MDGGKTVMNPKKPIWLYDYRFKCKICGKTFKNWISAASHCMRDHPEHEPWCYITFKKNIEYIRKPKNPK